MTFGLKTIGSSPVSGLDPAMPFFVTVNRDQKLDASDAAFVDVIHTNALVQGKIEASGDVDFYVNGGISQPGCWSESSKILTHSLFRTRRFAESQEISLLISKRIHTEAVRMTGVGFRSKLC
jgi:hypothetical protein